MGKLWRRERDFKWFIQKKTKVYVRPTFLRKKKKKKKTIYLNIEKHSVYSILPHMHHDVWLQKGVRVDGFLNPNDDTVW